VQQFIAVTVDVRLPRRPPHISKSCLLQPAWTTTPNRTEQNLIVSSGKAEVEVTNNRRLHTRYYTIEATTDRHEELLSELLVTDSSVYCLSLLNTVSAKDVLEFSSSGSLLLSSQNALDEQ